jgi:hypothetical protein
MKVHISYADGRYLESQEQCRRSALAIGGFDQSIALGRKDLDPDFLKRNHPILSRPRGAGYWLWKPYVILKTLRSLRPDDWLFYTDAGCLFQRPIQPMIDLESSRIERHGILMFESDHLERAYCKRDAFILMGVDSPRFADTPQCVAGFLLLRPTAFAMRFVESWLRWARDPRVLTDMGNTRGLPNYPDFRDHRHDQAILSLLGKMHDVQRIEDPSQWGDPPRGSREPEHRRIVLLTRDPR